MKRLRSVTTSARKSSSLSSKLCKAAYWTCEIGNKSHDNVIHTLYAVTTSCSKTESADQQTVSHQKLQELRNFADDMQADSLLVACDSCI